MHLINFDTYFISTGVIYMAIMTHNQESFSSQEPRKVLMLGLDAAGKTTILYKVKLDENVTTIPTIGFNVELVQHKCGLTFTVWDIGGQQKIRPLWKRYFPNTAGLIYVVDSCDIQRMSEAKKELHDIVNDDQMAGVPVVVLANKQDMPGAVSPSDMIPLLSLNDFTNRKWHIQGTCAVSGQGLYEAMDELTLFVKEFKR